MHGGCVIVYVYVCMTVCIILLLSYYYYHTTTVILLLLYYYYTTTTTIILLSYYYTTTTILLLTVQNHPNFDGAAQVVAQVLTCAPHPATGLAKVLKCIAAVAV